MFLFLAFYPPFECVQDFFLSNLPCLDDVCENKSVSAIKRFSVVKK